MLFSENVTFIIPIFRLKSDRIQNLKFIIPRILNTECKILIVEQAKDELSDFSDVIPVHENIKHLLYTSNSEIFHKSGIINWAVKNHVTTKYAWVNDVDFYMKFDKVLSEDWNSDFIKPYISGKKLSADDTKKIINGEKLNVSYEDESAEYISLYGALSFIFEKNAFLNIGGMDATIFGWGKEDIELNTRIKNLKINVQEMDFKGIHLWHPVEIVDVSITDKPTENTKDMAIIACHFNWCGFENPVRNLNRFLNQMEIDGIPVYGVELSLTDEFVTKNRKNWKHITVSKENICFQKEACINLAEKLVPEKYTKVAWIDCDLTFTNKNWYIDTSKKLNECKIVQLYEHGLHTDKRGIIIEKKNGVVFSGGPKAGGGYNGHPGGALAANREFFKRCGLYQYSFMGTGDTILINTIYRQPISNKNEEDSTLYKDWKAKLVGYLDSSEIGVVTGKFIHEWHGDRTNRNYSGRDVLLFKVDFSKNIKRDARGLTEISGVSDDVYDSILEYFVERHEDGKSKVEIGRTNDLAVMCSYFNWGNYFTPARNLNRFIRQMEISKIPVYGIELSLDDNYVTAGNKNWIRKQVKKENVCFQKEACLNVVEKTVPAQYTKLAWIDPDFCFTNTRWYEEASNKLNTHHAVQLFSTYVATDARGVEIRRTPSMMHAGGPNANKIHTGPPGCAWAARRDMWTTFGGLYPYSVIGGGDTVFVYTAFDMLFGEALLNSVGLTSVCNFHPYNNWRELIVEFLAPNKISYIQGDIIHEWHGDMTNRNYTTRYNMMKNFDHNKSLRMGGDGLIKITNVSEEFYVNMLAYFKNRNEDNIKI